MDEDELRVLEMSARVYQAIPKYLADPEEKDPAERALIDLIDALDILEYARSGDSFFRLIRGTTSFSQKKAILYVEKNYGLTKREGQILRYLANERNPSYISKALGISKTTAKTHKHAIYKKLDIHSQEELQQMLKKYDGNARASE